MAIWGKLAGNDALSLSRCRSPCAVAVEVVGEYFRQGRSVLGIAQPLHGSVDAQRFRPGFSLAVSVQQTVQHGLIKRQVGHPGAKLVGGFECDRAAPRMPNEVNRTWNRFTKGQSDLGRIRRRLPTPSLSRRGESIAEQVRGHTSISRTQGFNKPPPLFIPADRAVNQHNSWAGAVVQVIH